MEKAKGIISISLRLFTICFVSALILATVNFLTKDKIAENDRKAFEEGCFAVMPMATSFEKIEGSDMAIAKNSEGEVGVAVKVSVTGYSKGLNVMVGIDENLEIKGIKVLEHSETPGIGAEVVKVANEGKEYAVTGATKTVNGIDTAKEEALKIAKEYFAERG